MGRRLLISPNLAATLVYFRSLTKQISKENEEAVERKEADDLRKKLNELEAESWKVTKSKPLKVKNVQGKITDNNVSKPDRQSKSLDSVSLYLL
mgnify:CR=1 FL=1